MKALLAAVIFVMSAGASADKTICTETGSVYGDGRYYSGTTVCKTKKSRIQNFQGADGTSYYWTPQMKSYCYRNDYGNERCLHKSFTTETASCTGGDGAMICNVSRN